MRFLKQIVEVLAVWLWLSFFGIITASTMGWFCSDVTLIVLSKGIRCLESQTIIQLGLTHFAMSEENSLSSRLYRRCHTLCCQFFIQGSLQQS